MAEPWDVEYLLGTDAETWNRSREVNEVLHLSGADLSYENLANRNLSRASLGYANLRGANLCSVNLDHSTLMGANMENANLRGASLQSAVLTSVNLFRADLAGANLRGADLSGSDLRAACLIDADLSEATVTGVRLYGAAKDDWKIAAVKCDYVYWDLGGEQRTPDWREFESGEFERLYRCLPTVEYFFRRGMSPMDLLIMDRVVEAIHKGHPEFDIKIDSINARGLAPSVRFTVQEDRYKEPALAEVTIGFQTRIERLEAEKDRLYSLLSRAIDKTGTKLITAGQGR